MTTRIHVVSAAIVRPTESGSRILLAQRSGDTSYPWRWCTPGGKVEEGEAPQDALKREIREELDVSFWPGDVRSLVFDLELDPPVVRRPLRVACWAFSLGKIIGTPDLSDKVVGLGWFSAEDLYGVELAPADHAGREQLVRALGEVGG